MAGRLRLTFARRACLEHALTLADFDVCQWDVAKALTTGALRKAWLSLSPRERVAILSYSTRGLARDR